MWPVLGLFFLAPFVGEFLLGNIPITDMALGLLLAPLYGSGAILVRELGRRAGGWPSMLLLAAAYALIEEGPVDQLIWNNSYAGHDYLTGPSYVPFLGTSVEVVQSILALHTIWSISVPIALVETLSRRGPWLHTRGLVVVGLLFLTGSAFVFWGNYTEEHFMAEWWQFGYAFAAIALLVFLAFRIRPLPSSPGTAPPPLRVCLFALLGTSAYWGSVTLISADWFEWPGVTIWCAVVALGIALVTRWSRLAGWDQRHRFALAAGAVLTYVWCSFPVKPELGGTEAGDYVFSAIALSLLLWCVLKLRAEATTPANQPVPYSNG
ncbi:hypothetical protein [Lentzea sp. NPDC051838]|uniref:hypothetical protein n=1 Tax=Lentzea sp. NPDC051838 TaxID=3154849 RepID=UPI0034165FD8